MLIYLFITDDLSDPVEPPLCKHHEIKWDVSEAHLSELLYELNSLNKQLQVT